MATNTSSESHATALTPQALRSPSVLWASLGGIGFLRPAPGTWGSAGAVVLWWLLAPLAPLLQLALIVAYFLVSWWTAHRITQRLSVADAPQIVADEVVGMWLALWLIGIVSDAAPASIDATPALLALVWAAAFALFRWLDIAKPSLIGWLDTNIKGGLGVMLDDVVAGLVTGGVIGIVLWLTTLG